ncbi:DNA polymerase III subunit delta' [Geitlerinema sp. P-1104]|uniref:DNA polymerase III subunit delta' n=1 Tax=Geitlerinema sp. P-1104 TaxID=2546230 RepID=UPI0014776F40|nr:DNA polymerase III subunit delta' [Geitlerinema sp. P-1104]
MSVEKPIGQEAGLRFLEAALARDRIAPAYLFVGADGIGRGLAARYFARRLLGDSHPNLTNHPDFLLVEPTYLDKKELYTVTQAREKGLKRKSPPQIRLQQIRELSQFLANPPLEASRKLIIIEQAELMAEAAANGLLKTLEEPGRASLILIAPSSESLLPTLVSRCQRIPFSRLSREQMGEVLQMTGHGEILNQPAILAIAQGSPGVAIAAWDQQNAIPPELLENVHQFPRSLRDALELAKEINTTLDTPEQLWLLDYLQQTYWHSSGGSLSPRILEALEEARRHLRRFVQPRLVWEVTLMKVASGLGDV